MKRNRAEEVKKILACAVLLAGLIDCEPARFECYLQASRNMCAEALGSRRQFSGSSVDTLWLQNMPTCTSIGAADSIKWRVSNKYRGKRCA